MTGEGTSTGRTSTGRLICVLAYSGGLDTSYCVIALRDAGYDVVTVAVDTGSFTAEEAEEIGSRARQLGALEHRHIDARKRVFDEHLRYLLWGNCLRGQVYPYCVGAERITQARVVAEAARELGASAVAHGSTGAGNDQVRFDIAFRVLCGNMEILTPIRERHLSREETTALLKTAGIEFPAKRSKYSVNAGLWGTTIGGGETHDPWKAHPEDAFTETAAPSKVGLPAREIVIGFEQGVPASLDGEALPIVDLLLRLKEIALPHGVGRGYHLGDTIFGIKGRIAFEAAVPLILIQAHRELEKLVMTGWQQFWKEQLGQFYGKALHEALYFDPVMRDIEAYLANSQRPVSGEARVVLDRGNILISGVRSPHSMMDTGLATYGETHGAWDAKDARGFIKILGMPSALAARAAEKNNEDEEAHP